MHMSIIDRVREAGLQDINDMSGLERTEFMNDLFLDYQASKDLRQKNLESDHVHERYKWCLDNKVIVFTEIQCYWIEYKNEYKKYRGVDTKEERKTIKERIDQIRYKLNLKDKKNK